MVTVDQLEVLLRTIPQYFLFAGIGLYIFAWMYKRPKLAMGGEIVFVVLGLVSLIILMSGMVPSPQTQGLVEAHVKLVIRVLTMFMVIGLLSVVSLALRLFLKKGVKILVLVIFGISLYTFFLSTNMSKVDFQLNRPQVENGVDY